VGLCCSGRSDQAHGGQCAEDTITGSDEHVCTASEKIKAIRGLLTRTLLVQQQQHDRFDGRSYLTALLYEGAGPCRRIKSRITFKASLIVAPIGLQHLTPYDEDYELWQQLFLDDNIHSSVHGSIFASVCIVRCLTCAPPVSLFRRSISFGRTEINGAAAISQLRRNSLPQQRGSTSRAARLYPKLLRPTVVSAARPFCGFAFQHTVRKQNEPNKTVAFALYELKKTI
jgi:hypothetical protein